MPHRSTPWSVWIRWVLMLGMVVGLTPAATAAATPWMPVTTERSASPRIVGGTVLTNNSSAPYTVAIQTQFGDATFGGCSGTLISPQHVLTAAHCFVRDNVAVPAENIRVGVGYHEIVSPEGRAAVTVVPVASVRVHPRYVSEAFPDDVAVLTLPQPLDLTTGRVAVLPMVPAGTTIPSNTPVRVTGFGASAATANDFGTLRSVNTRSQFSSLCGTDAPAVMLCTFRAGHAACEGDSGGTATIKGGTQLVGVTNTAVRDCAAGLNLFSNVAAPEIRTFIDAAIAGVDLTAEQIPVAPRGGTAVRVSGTVVPGRTITCQRGAWAGSANRYRYRFLRFRGERAQTTSSRRSRTYRVRRNDRGWRVSCVVEAKNAGGTGVAIGRKLRAVR